MSWLRAALVLALWPGTALACPGGLDGTFVQINDAQVRWSRRHWQSTLDELSSMGVRTIVLQHTGDPFGSFENRYGARPISTILEEANARRMRVWLGLAHSPGWPYTVPPRFAPLADPRAVEELGRLCHTHESCAGFYLSPEFDDATWGERTAEVRSLLIDAVRTLRRRVPAARIAIAPYFTRTRSPDAHAAWWGRVLDGIGIDVVMLQGGTGTGRASADNVRAFVRPLAELLSRRGIETWLVVELFAQRRGPPFDGSAFAAEPAQFGQVSAALLSDEPLVRHRIAFTVLDYMNARTARGARLRREYLAFCQPLPRARRRGTRGSP